MVCFHNITNVSCVYLKYIHDGVSRIERNLRQVNGLWHEIHSRECSSIHPKVLSKNLSRLNADRDAFKGSTDTPRKATQGCSATLNLQTEYAFEQKGTPQIYSWEDVRFLYRSEATNIVNGYSSIRLCRYNAAESVM